MSIKTLDFKTEIKAAENDNVKTFEAYASTFGNVDSHLDIIMKGAFLESLKKRTPKLAYQHNVTKLAGVITEAKEDDFGLKVKGDFLDTELGIQAYKEVKAGAIDSLSIGYATKDAEYLDNGVRELKEVDLYEVSFVTFPANDKAIVTNVKADDIKTKKEFEILLRDAGFSRKEATRIALHGFKTSEEIQRDADNSELNELINNLNKKFRGN